MATIQALNKMLADLHESLCLAGFAPTKMVLFGSYAKGRSHRDSDIDVAIWSPKFSGSIALDMEFLAPVKRNFPLIKLHTFSEGDDEASNPFIEEIMKEGKVWEIDAPLIFR